MEKERNLSTRWKIRIAIAVLGFSSGMLPLSAGAVTTYTFNGSYNGFSIGSTLDFTVTLPETLSQVKNLTNFSVPSVDFTVTPIPPSVVMDTGYVFTAETFASDSLSITTNSAGDITAFTFVETYDANIGIFTMPPPGSVTFTYTATAVTSPPVPNGEILNAPGSGRGSFTDSIAPDGSPAPEPSSVLLFATGGIGMLWFAARRRRDAIKT
jgi:hypothetical protein